MYGQIILDQRKKTYKFKSKADSFKFKTYFNEKKKLEKELGVVKDDFGRKRPFNHYTVYDDNKSLIKWTKERIKKQKKISRLNTIKYWIRHNEREIQRKIAIVEIEGRIQLILPTNKYKVIKEIWK